MPNKVIQCPIVHILNEHEKRILIVVREKILNNVLALTDTHDCYFLFQLLQIFVVIKGNDSNRKYCLLIFPRTGLINFTHASLADLMKEIVFLGWLRETKLDLLELIFEFTCT